MFTGRRPALALMVTGVFSVLNGLIAALKNTERHFYLSDYLNTHWITSIVFCAGLVHRTTIDGDYYGEVFSFTTNLLCVCISLTAIISDYSNLKYIGGFTNNTKLDFVIQDKQDHLYLYNVLDMLVCIIAIPCSIYIIRYLLQSNNHLPKTRKNSAILGLGTGLIVVSVLRAVVFLLELNLNKSQRIRSVYFINYTIDEPAWILTAITCGVVTVLSADGSDLLRGVSMALSCTLMWPAIFYVWVDYRQMLGNKALPLERGYNNLVFLGSSEVALGIIQAFILLSLALAQLSQFPGTCKIRLQTNVRNLFIGLCSLFLVAFVAIVVLDVYAAFNNLFYTLFHPSEQKTPFYLLILIVSALVSIIPGFATLTLPLSFTVCLLTANSTLFQIGSYFYLTHNGYFALKMCESEIYEDACSRRASSNRVHLVETLAHFAVLIGCAIYGIILVRIFHLNVVDREMNDVDKKRTRRFENVVRTLGVSMCTGALLILISLGLRDRTFDDIHPLLTIYGSIYHFSLAISLVVYPLYQIVCCEKMYKYPMTIDSLICLSAVRFVDCLTHMDYRGTGDDLSLQWRIHTAVDYLSLFSTLITMICLLHIRAIGKPQLERLEDIDMDFNNPLHANRAENGGNSYQVLQNRFENEVVASSQAVETARS
ncbi:unnamed protein product [Auanema sp. JU1783]|nr:unnamed protein product [Auanema sp. JU1783]